MLTDQQKDDICMVVSSGCDRETAAKYARTSWAELHRAMSEDREFAAHVRHKEAVAELAHMLQIRKASAKESNWRSSVWWLETLAPERYGPRGSSLVTGRQLKLFIEHIATTLVSEVRNEEDRERLLQRLHSTAQSLDIFLRDECVSSEPAACAVPLLEVDSTPSEEPSVGVSTSAETDEDSA